MEYNKKLLFIRTTLSLFFVIVSCFAIYKRFAINANVRVAQTNKVNDFSDEDKYVDKVLYNKAVTLCENNNFESAVNILKSHLLLFPDHAQAYYLLGRIYEDNILPGHQGKLYTEMKVSYLQYLKLKPSGVRANYVKLSLAQYYIRSSLNTNNREEIDMATNLLKGLDQTDPDVKMALGAIYLSKKNYGQAVEEFENAINSDPDEITTKYNSLGFAYIRLGKFPEARKALEIAVNIDPENPFAHNNLGYVYLKLGKFAMAKHEFKKAAVLNPKYKNAVKNYRWMCQDKEIIRKIRNEAQLTSSPTER